MKLFRYELSDWTRCAHNFWRLNNYKIDDATGVETYNFGIGLIVNDAKAKRSRQFWEIDSLYDNHPAIRSIMPFLRKNTKSYSYDELDQAKQDVDDLIIRINKLKAFL